MNREPGSDCAAVEGIGAANVDTVLEVPYSGIRPGDEIIGRVIVSGGTVAQQINGIELLIMTSYIKEVGDSKVRDNAVIAKLPLRGPFEIKAGSKEEIPFRWELPLTTPTTVGGTQVWIKTDLDIASSLDASDNDYIKVLPHPLAQKVFEALSSLGFHTREAECKYAPYSRYGTPLLQEFELVPGRGSRFSRLEELEVVFIPAADYVDVLMEIDRRSGAFAEWLGSDESRISFRLHEADIRQGTGRLAEDLAARINSYI
jgi:sporulation-control protein